MKYIAIALMVLLLAGNVQATNDKTELDGAYIQGVLDGFKMANLFYQGQAGNETAMALFQAEVKRVDAIANPPKKTGSDLANFGKQKSFNVAVTSTPEEREASIADSILTSFAQ